MYTSFLSLLLSFLRLGVLMVCYRSVIGVLIVCYLCVGGLLLECYADASACTNRLATSAT